MEEINGKKFGDKENPLLVSVRSGARASMPGMMDTILNLGLNDDVVAGMIAKNSDIKFVRFVYDSYRRFIQMFSDVVMGLAKSTFEVIIDEVKEKKGVKNDIDLDADDMKELVRLFKAHYKNCLLYTAQSLNFCQGRLLSRPQGKPFAPQLVRRDGILQGGVNTGDHHLVIPIQHSGHYLKPLMLIFPGLALGGPAIEIPRGIHQGLSLIHIFGPAGSSAFRITIGFSLSAGGCSAAPAPVSGQLSNRPG